MKTSDYYRRTIVSAVRGLYNDTINVNEFTAQMNQLIINQLYAAWNQGMRENGLDPEKDMTRAHYDLVKEIVDNERSFVRNYATDIVAARANETFDGIRTRAEAWAGRYQDVKDRAIVTTAKPGKRGKWVVGNTEHCETCLALNNVVATMEDWQTLQERGIYPKSPNLACHGDHCQCEIIPTDDDLTKGGIPNV